MSTTTVATCTHALTTADGEHIELRQTMTPDGTPDRSIIEVAEEAGMLLPSSCRAGNCGACHARAEGRYTLGEHARTVLDDDAAAAGDVLLCRTYARGPLNITLPYERSRIISGRIPEHTATVAAIERVATDTVHLVLELGPDEQGAMGCEFDPGQFLELTIPGTTTRRSYSLANLPNWDGAAELFIKLREGGEFSRFLRGVQAGQKLAVRGPQGAFGVRDTGIRPRWFIAGGTGLSPLLSMLRRMAEWDDPQPARLWFGVQAEEEIFGLDAMESLAAELPGFRYDVMVGHPSAGWQGPVGTPLDGLADALAEAPAAPDIYVCGPPGMVAATKRIAAESGLPAERVLVENFAPSA